MDFTIGIVSQNLATMSNFVKFRDNQNFTFFEAPRVVQDTYAFECLKMRQVSSGELVKQIAQVGPRRDMGQHMIGGKSKVDG